MAERWQDELVEHARATLPAHVFHYISVGAREGVSLAESLEAWHEVRFHPMVLRDVRRPKPTTTLLGHDVEAPIGIAPTSLQRLVHPDGELAMARAAAATGTLLVVSSNAGTTFAEIGTIGATWWLQVYATADRSLTASTFVRAAEAGASALVLTVDTPMPGTKYDVDDGAFGDLSQAYGLNHPEAVRGTTPGAEHAMDLREEDLAWLSDLTGLPVVVKGVLRADDAARCVDAGAEAVWVSNHGGRQLDRAQATAHALPEVARAVGDRAEVYVDGGIRSGLDVLAASGLGARGVFIGRLPLYGLGVGGADGAARVLRTLRDELVEAMRLAGCAELPDARRIVVPPAPPTS